MEENEHIEKSEQSPRVSFLNKALGLFFSANLLFDCILTERKEEGK